MALNKLLNFIYYCMILSYRIFMTCFNAITTHIVSQSIVTIFVMQRLSVLIYFYR